MAKDPRFAASFRWLEPPRTDGRPPEVADPDPGGAAQEGGAEATFRDHPGTSRLPSRRLGASLHMKAELRYCGAVMDIWSETKRSEVMSRIRGKDTKPEKKVRSLLHRMGYRFTVNGPKNRMLPGRPDIVLPKYRTAVFVHGCFWHRHDRCRYAYMPKARQPWWRQKFKATVIRDKQAARRLRILGWRVVTIWECELRIAVKLTGLERRLRKALPTNP